MTHYTARAAHASADSAWDTWRVVWRAAKPWRVLRGNPAREAWKAHSALCAVYCAARNAYNAYLCGKPA